MRFGVVEFFPEIRNDMSWFSSECTDFDYFSEIARAWVVKSEEAT